jgi:hypothetical protein
VPFKRVAVGPETRTVICGELLPVPEVLCEQPTIRVRAKPEAKKAESRIRARERKTMMIPSTLSQSSSPIRFAAVCHLK